jgi:hypothetical protein
MARHGQPDPARDPERAEHKAAQLHKLGPMAVIWARGVSDELARHESAREKLSMDNQEELERVYSTALLLVVAIDQVLTFERRVRGLTGDAELARARARFDAVAPRAEALRDLVAHLDEYAIGVGQRQTKKRRPPITDPYVEALIHWTPSGGTIVDLAGEALNLQGAAKAAVELANVVERVRVRYLDRAEREANVALRRRYGLDS